MFAHRHLRSTAIALASVLLVSLGTPAFATTTPARATGLKATPTSSSVTLTWKVAKNAKLYSVCLTKSKAATGCYKRTAKSTARKLVIRHLKPTGGRDYFFKVFAYRGSVHSTSAKLGFDLKPAVLRPAAVTGMTHSVTDNSAAITWPAARNATGYSVCLMTRKATETCAKRSPKSATRTASFAGLEPTTGADYYYRVYSYRGTASAMSAKPRFDLPVGAVPGFAAPQSTSTTSIDYAWGATTNADRYELQLATNLGMTSGLKKLVVTGTTYQATQLVPGTKYYYRLRGLNGSTPGPFTRVVAQRLPTDPFDTTIVTYNLCGQDYCRRDASAAFRAAVPVWSKRKPLAGTIARSTGADVIATQESAKATNFVTQLPGFSLGAYYSAKSLYYRTAKYTKLRSGTITLDSASKKYAVWVELRDKVTMTRFIVSDTHTVSGKGAALDAKRKAQTQYLLAGVAKANPRKLSVVYAGDFNSNKANANQDNYPGGYDAPLQVMTAAGMNDSIDTSELRTNSDWNSGNQGRATPTRHRDHIDHIFVDPSIAVSSWKVFISIVNANNYTTPFATDHNPVAATLTIPGSS